MLKSSILSILLLLLAAVAAAKALENEDSMATVADFYKLFKEGEANMQQEIYQLKAENIEMFKDLNKLKSDHIEEGKTLRLLLTDQKQQLSKFALMENELNHLKGLYMEQAQELNKLQKLTENAITSNSCSVDNSTIISFTAYATESRTYDTDTTIIFDGVLRNYGGFYNPDISVFNCGKNGYYLFSCTLYSEGDHDLEGEIVVDGEPLVNADSNPGLDQGTNLVVTYCSAAKQVYVRVVLNSGRLSGDRNYLRTTFSGTLLFEVN